MNATIRISEPHLSHIRGFIPYTLFISLAQAERFESNKTFPYIILVLL